MNEEHISKAIRNQFKFKIENETDKVRRVAIIPAYLQKMNAITEKKDLVVAVDDDGEAITEKIAILKGVTYAKSRIACEQRLSC